jgi:hypothetical protein
MPGLKMTVLEQATEDNKVFTRWVYESRTWPIRRGPMGATGSP